MPRPKNVGLGAERDVFTRPLRSMEKHMSDRHIPKRSRTWCCRATTRRSRSRIGRRTFCSTRRTRPCPAYSYLASRGVDLKLSLIGGPRRCEGITGTPNLEGMHSLAPIRLAGRLDMRRNLARPAFPPAGSLSYARSSKAWSPSSGSTPPRSSFSPLAISRFITDALSLPPLSCSPARSRRAHRRRWSCAGAGVVFVNRGASYRSDWRWVDRSDYVGIGPPIQACLVQRSLHLKVCPNGHALERGDR